MADRLNALVRRGAYLPHWTKEGATYSVSFRLADSLPQHVLREWQEERKELLKKSAEKLLTKEDHERLRELFSEKVEKYLKAGYGACWMNNDAIAMIVVQRLRRYEGKLYELYAWCIMPNHVHVVVRPLTKELHKIVEDWKGVSARKINKVLKRSGIFWQEECFDHLIRNEEDFEKSIEYVWKNPEEAGLQNWKWRWKADGY